ncbi:protease, partial [Tricholoma matsutake]
HSLNLAIELQTTDTRQILGVSVLLDSGVTGLFIDGHLAQHHLNTHSLLHLIPVYNVDGSPNEAGAIREIVDLVLHYKDHSEHCGRHALFAVTQLGKQKVILGYPWL